MKRKALCGYLMITPIMLILIGLFVMGLIESVIQSLGYFPSLGQTEWTFQYYIQVLKDPYFMQSLGYTLFFSMISALIAVIMGVCLAYALLQVKGSGKLVESLLKIPVYVPHIVGIALVYMMLGQTGVLARVAYMLGFIEEAKDFPIWVQDSKGIGIMVVYIWKGIPFAMITVLTILRNIDSTLAVAAKNLGAKSKDVFLKIQLPLILPTLLSSFIILFAFAFGAFEVPYLIGANVPKALPVWAYLEHTSSHLEGRIYAMVLNVVMIAVSFVLLAIYMKVNKKIKRYR